MIDNDTALRLTAQLDRVISTHEGASRWLEDVLTEASRGENDDDPELFGVINGTARAARDYADRLDLDGGDTKHQFADAVRSIADEMQFGMPLRYGPIDGGAR